MQSEQLCDVSFSTSKVIAPHSAEGLPQLITSRLIEYWEEILVDTQASVDACLASNLHGSTTLLSCLAHVHQASHSRPLPSSQ